MNNGRKRAQRLPSSLPKTCIFKREEAYLPKGNH